MNNAERGYEEATVNKCVTQNNITDGTACSYPTASIINWDTVGRQTPLISSPTCLGYVAALYGVLSQ